MIWRLFRPRPIFVLTLPTILPMEEQAIVKEALKKELGNEYKVVLLMDSHKTYVETKILK
jgi:3'-phosphoadenosine 5'-phosphosulfate sulfotransferase (PAPS reductase)/FAD synthetase